MSLVAVYALSGAWLLGSVYLHDTSPFWPSWMARTNPVMLLARRTSGTGPTTLTDATYFLGGSILAAIVLLEITVAAFRRVVLRQARPRRGR